MKKLSLLLIGLLSIVVLAACGDNGNNENNNGNNESAAGNENMEMPEPDLDDVPDVVAEVNGEDVTKEDFEEMYMQQFQEQAMYAQMTGEEINEDELKGQVLESLIDQQVFFQEADKRFPEASEDGINEVLEEIMASAQVDSKEDLIAMYEENGMSEEELMENIELQVRINQLMDEEIGEVEIDDKEIEEAYEEVVEQQEAANEGAEEPQEIPEYDEVKDMIADNLRQQKEAEAFQVIIDDLRDQAEIKVHM